MTLSELVSWIVVFALFIAITTGFLYFIGSSEQQRTNKVYDMTCEELNKQLHIFPRVYVEDQIRDTMILKGCKL